MPKYNVYMSGSDTDSANDEIVIEVEAESAFEAKRTAEVMEPRHYSWNAREIDD